MHVIVHRIRLHEGVDPVSFETWVRETDYALCPQLPSVRSFSVQRVTSAADAPFHYFEVITVSSNEEFERDVEGGSFQELFAQFEKMASVVDELSGERVEPGYQAA